MLVAFFLPGLVTSGMAPSGALVYKMIPIFQELLFGVFATNSLLKK
jgi:hypothetical protein